MGNIPDIRLCNCKQYFIWQKHENTILQRRYFKL
jgi:hypothetical protein